ncbi:uncharacterized protein LOC144434905 [Glandiceps talaboti]
MAPPAPPAPPPPPPEPETLMSNSVKTIQGDSSEVNGPMNDKGATGLSNGPVAEGSGEGKSWERPWTISELRKGSTNWSLASDSGLLLYMQEFSQKMISRTHEIEKQVEGLVHSTKSTDGRLHNVFNDFLMLSNTQFIENRVYDDSPEEADSKQEMKEDKDKKEEDKSREEKESDLIPKVTEAIGYGLSVLDNAFDKLDIKDAISDSEDEDETNVAYRNDPILEPKDLYAHRPLPHLIGSQDFLQDDDVGLGDIMSEEEEEEEEDEDDESEQESVSESEEESESDSEEESGSEDEKPTKRRTKSKISAKDVSDESGDLFGGDSDEEHESEGDLEEDKPKRTKGPGFAAELAAKLGTPSPLGDSDDEWEEEKPVRQKSDTVTSRDSHKSQKKKKGKEEKKSSKKAKEKKVEEENDDLFGPPPQDDIFGGDDSPFGRKSGLFSGGSGLFDDDDVSDGLFDEKPAKKKEVEKEEVQEKKVEKKPKQTKSGKKLPAGAVSLFGPGGDDMFTDKTDEPEDNEEVEDIKKPDTKPVSKPSLSSGLFDDDDDDDLFSPSVTKTTKKESTKPKTQKTKTVDLFGDDGNDDEDDDDDDFFSRKPPKLDKASPKKVQKLHFPIGGVAVFGDVGPLGGETEADMKPKKTVKKDDQKADVGSGLFIDEEEEDDQFLSAPSTAKVESKPKPKKSSSAVSSGLFADESDDPLFSTSTSTSTKSKPSSKPASSSGLFGGGDDDEDDLFSTTLPKPKDSKKKPVGGVAIFGGADLFGERKSVSEDDVQPKEEKSAESTQPQKKTEEVKVVKKKPPTTLSLFDDDDEKDDDDNDDGLFGTPSKEPPPPQPPQPQPQQRNKPRSKSKSLFADEDVLFGGGSEDTPDVDLFSPTSPVSPDRPKFPTSEPKQEEKKSVNASKPKPAVKSSSLFGGDDDDDDDLFGSAKKAEPRKAVKQSTVKQKDKKTSSATRATPTSSLFVGDDDDLFSITKKAEPRKNIKTDTQSKNTVHVAGATTSVSSTDTVEDILGNKTSGKRKEEIKGVKKQPLNKKDDDGDVDDLFGDNSKPKVETDEKTKTSGNDDIDSIINEKKTSKENSPSKKKPVGGVALFGGVDHLGGLKRTPSPEDKEDVPVKDPIFGGDDDDDGLFSRRPPPMDPESPEPTSASITKPKPKPIPSSKPSLPSPAASPTLSKKEESTENDVLAQASKSNNVGKLQANLNINPSALLPGATPSPREYDPTPVSFEEAATFDTLTTLQKGRTRGHANRRPPKRRGRQTSVTQDKNTGDIPNVNSENDIFDGIPGSNQTKSHSSDIFGNDDLLGEKSRIDDPFMSVAPSEPKDLDVDDGLFTSQREKKSKTTFDDDLFGPSILHKTVDDVDDIFDSPSKQTGKKTKETTGGDDKLAATGAIPKKYSKKEPKKTTLMNEDDDDDDLFASPKKTKKTKSKTKESDLFADNTDIFADLPASKTKEKKKKKDKDPLFKEVEGGDIFGEAKSSPKRSKTKKKTEKKSTAASGASIFDSDAPSIFDDPLSATKK